MSKHGGARRKNHGYGRASSASKADCDNEVSALFRAASAELDNRHDRYERLVKLSRDITIESKRIIFLLHSAIKESERITAISDAGKRLEALRNGVILKAAKELDQAPLYLYHRPLSVGLQEYVEAATLYGWLLKGTIPLHKELQAEFVFSIPNNDDTIQTVSLMLPDSDYILGLADLTGELMRRCINVLSNGDTDECSTICQLLQRIQSGFLSVGGAGYEVSRKMYTMRNNISKSEAVVYAIHVRGGEAPPSLLLPPPATGPGGPPFSSSRTGESEEDEGFY